MASVGFSTGDLYKTELSLDEIIERYHSTKAEAIELNFGSKKLLLEYELKEESKEMLKDFNYLSAHAPFVESEYGYNKETEKIIKKLKELHKELNFDGIVVHPNDVEDFEALEETNLPFLIENMDHRKPEGKKPRYFKRLKENYSFGFILDVEHVYENDESMELGQQIIEVMGDRLKHMHVSGCRGEKNHYPAYKSENKEEITKILEMGIDVPKILEGVIIQDTEETIQEELDYVKSFEQ